MPYSCHELDFDCAWVDEQLALGLSQCGATKAEGFVDFECLLLHPRILYIASAAKAWKPLEVRNVDGCFGLAAAIRWRTVRA